MSGIPFDTTKMTETLGSNSGIGSAINPGRGDSAATDRGTQADMSPRLDYDVASPVKVNYNSADKSLSINGGTSQVSDTLEDSGKSTVIAKDGTIYGSPSSKTKLVHDLAVEKIKLGDSATAAPNQHYLNPRAGTDLEVNMGKADGDNVTLALWEQAGNVTITGSTQGDAHDEFGDSHHKDVIDIRTGFEGEASIDLKDIDSDHTDLQIDGQSLGRLDLEEGILTVKSDGRYSLDIGGSGEKESSKLSFELQDPRPRTIPGSWLGETGTYSLDIGGSGEKESSKPSLELQDPRPRAIPDNWLDAL